MATKAPTTFCRTTLNYVGASPGGRGPRQVDVLNGREAELPGWEECGFELLQHKASVEDWDDDDRIVAVHYAEMAALAKQLSGCDQAIVAGHIKRSPQEAKRHRDLAPITLVHSDFADNYADRIRERYRAGGADESVDAGELVANARRLLILQFWRNIGPAKMDLPLAFCDARTVPREHIRAFPVNNYAGGGFNFDALGILAPPRTSSHDWYVFPEMNAHEVIAFRTYDTDRVADGRAPYWTPHSAIRDPEVPLGEPSRSSIELRATCVFL